MTPDGVPNHFTKFFHALSFGEDVMAESAGLIAALWRLLHGENDFGFWHVLSDYTLAATQSKEMMRLVQLEPKLDHEITDGNESRLILRILDTQKISGIVQNRTVQAPTVSSSRIVSLAEIRSAGILVARATSSWTRTAASRFRETGPRDAKNSSFPTIPRPRFHLANRRRLAITSAMKTAGMTATIIATTAATITFPYAMLL